MTSAPDDSTALQQVCRECLQSTCSGGSTALRQACRECLQSTCDGGSTALRRVCQECLQSNCSAGSTALQQVCQECLQPTCSAGSTALQPVCQACSQPVVVAALHCSRCARLAVHLQWWQNSTAAGVPGLQSTCSMLNCSRQMWNVAVSLVRKFCVV